MEEIYGSMEGFLVWNEDTVQSIFSKSADNWEEFRLRYPETKGILHVSAPGFADDGDYAVVYVGRLFDR